MYMVRVVVSVVFYLFRWKELFEAYTCVCVYSRLSFVGLYGASSAAAKSAAHELNGIRAYIKTHPLLSTPLMAMIEYCGFKFACSSVIPLSGSSLRYGSADAGMTVHADVTEVFTLSGIMFCVIL
jgi:hypothetical protein